MSLQILPVWPSAHLSFASLFNANHRGIDIFASRGTPIVAVDDGNVRSADDPKGGNAVYLSATDGTSYYYAHLDEYVGSFPRAVKAGDPIGTVGTSGNAIGKAPHLHFEVHSKDDGTIDPYPLLIAAAPAKPSTYGVPPSKRPKVAATGIGILLAVASIAAYSWMKARRFARV
jgi:murein DD-endopeptidase MepM/ murein hydrolase activator NlpD